MDVNRKQTLVEGCIGRVLEFEDKLELVEATVSGKGGSSLLRVYIYKPSGVTIEDCARVSRRLSRELEHEPGLDEYFNIEVSSPGLDRRLQTRRDFERAVGEVLHLKVKDKQGMRSVRGRLTEVEEETLLLDLPPEKAGGSKTKVSGDPTRVHISSIREGSIEVSMQ